MGISFGRVVQDVCRMKGTGRALGRTGLPHPLPTETNKVHKVAPQTVSKGERSPCTWPPVETHTFPGRSPDPQHLRMGHDMEVASLQMYCLR